MAVWTMKRFSAAWRFITFLFLGVALVATLGCDDDPTGESDCDKSVSPNLQRVMYWGRVEPDHEVPNRGEPGSEILKPLWYAPDRILVVSQRLNHGLNVRGLFDISIDPATRAFRDFNTLSFPYAILAFDYDTQQQTYLILYTRSTYHVEVITANASNGILVPGLSVVDSTWVPLGARFVSDGQAAVVYCLAPPAEPAGFFRFSLTDQSSDSLLVEDVLYDEAAGFDVGPTCVFYGRTTGQFPYHAELMKYPLSGAESPTKITSLAGEFVSVTVNSDETCALVSRYYEGRNSTEPPGNRIDVVDLISGEVQHIDVRTHPCMFAIADFGTWNPQGGGFAFSAAAFSSEGDLLLRELWICGAASCR